MKVLTNIYKLLVPKSKVLLLFIIVVLLLAIGYLFKMMEEEDDSDDEDDEFEGMQAADDDPELNDAVQVINKEESILSEGPRGNIGIRGKKGEIGVQGIQGYQGDQGGQGVQGSQGDKGVKGVQGIKGDKGVQGVRGPTGPVDKTAFNVAMDNKNQMADLMARTAAAEATAAAALSKASMPPRIPKPPRRRRRFRFWSDMRLKENILQVGVSNAKIPIYTYNYRNFMNNLDGIDVKRTYKGVIAQDLVELGYNYAVIKDEHGILSVDYNKIDVNFEEL